METVIIAEPQSLMREGLVLILRSILGEKAMLEGVSDYPELLSIVREIGADMVLLDPYMPGCPGPSVFTDLRERLPQATLVAVSGVVDASKIAESISNGARGYIPKQSGSNILEAALALIRAGGIYIPSIAMADRQAPSPAPMGGTFRPIRSDVPQPRRRSHLTDRQRQVLAGIQRGMSNREIAEDLDMSEGTVKNHVKALMKALNVRNRTQAAMIQV